MRTLSALVLAVLPIVAFAEYPGVGRDATQNEVRAWDIDVRPDFKGLPPGKGSVADGETLWTEKCSSCHGDFGDANHVFTPLIGNTTAKDIETGHVASLKAGGSVRTTFTKVATVSTLWDYIRRAMPWNAPKSLSNDQVYAVLAYLLNLAEVVPQDFVLDEKNIADVQQKMPNRLGTTRDHGLWDIHGKPDTHNVACMMNCKPDVKILSELPSHARGSHGNLADQNRTFGEVRGAVTVAAAAAPAATTSDAEAGAPASNSAPATTGAATPSAVALLAPNGCTGCHAVDKKILGPSFAEVAAKYKGRDDAKTYLSGKIRAGGMGVWGQVPMPPQPQLSASDLDTIAAWLAAGAKP